MNMSYAFDDACWYMVARNIQDSGNSDIGVMYLLAVSVQALCSAGVQPVPAAGGPRRRRLVAGGPARVRATPALRQAAHHAAAA